MRKEILEFRAWDGLNKTMSSWTMNDLCFHDGKSEHPSFLDIWTQYTGLLDRNGKKIFEGDIIKNIDGYGKEVMEVVYNYSGYKLRRANGYFMEIPTIRRDFEIIGNVYENPEIIVK